MSNTINISEVLGEMLKAVEGVLKKNWKDVKPFAEQEFKSFTENLQLINRLKSEGKITKKQAKLYVEIQKSSVRIVLLTIEGLGILAVENAINAAIKVVKKTVNTAIGWTIL